MSRHDHTRHLALWCGSDEALDTRTRLVAAFAEAAAKALADEHRTLVGRVLEASRLLRQAEAAILDEDMGIRL